MTMTTPATESSDSSELEAVAGSNGEARIELEGGDCRISLSGPERDDERTDWGKVLITALQTWESMIARVHANRIAEIWAEQGGRPGPASAGFIAEQSSERRNGMLPGGTGAMPV